jgi:large subunit ribosomal protein L1
MAIKAISNKEKTEKKSTFTSPSKAPSKRFQESKRKVEHRSYLLEEALTLAKRLANAKFDESMEAHFRLGIDYKQTAQQVRGNTSLPHGTGKKLRILVFAEGDQANDGKKAGAEVADEAIINQIEKGSVPFDVIIATPDMMPKIAKLARTLGTRGLMPNPKNETVTYNIKRTIEERSSGLVDFKNESNLIHLSFGKSSFSTKDLQDNLIALFQAVQHAKPPKTTKDYLQSLSISSTMGPGISVDIDSIKESLK